MSLENLKSLNKILYSLINIQFICHSQQVNIALFDQISNCINEKIIYLKCILDYTISSDKCFSPTQIGIKPGTDKYLDILKTLYYHLPTTISLLYAKNLDSMLSDIENYRLVYFPTLGFGIAIMSNNNDISEKSCFDKLEYKFTSNGTNYYKTPLTERLDKIFENIHKSIIKRNIRLIARFESLFSDNAKAISDAIYQCGKLDALISLYEVAEENNFVKPQLRNNNIINVKKGTYPLKMNSEFVSNDIISCHKNVVHLCVGPNGCGKTTYLKQIGQILYLAHIGSFVPAESADISILSRILTCISNHESISIDSSTFLQDIRQVSQAISEIEEKSLIIVDDFGKGTLVKDSEIILISLIKELINKENSFSHTYISSTNSDCITEYFKNNNRVKILSFEYLKKNSSIVFSHRLLNTSVESNYLNLIAEISLLEDSIILQAMKIQESIKLHTNPWKNLNMYNQKSKILENGANILHPIKDNLSPFMNMKKKMIIQLIESNILIHSS